MLKITNITQGPVALPAPLSGWLAPGEACIVDRTATEVASFFAPADMARLGVKLEELAASEPASAHDAPASLEWGTRTAALYDDTSTAQDEVLLVTDLFTLTLHSAVGVAGRKLTVMRAGGGKLLRLVLVPASGEEINDLGANVVATVLDAASVVLVSDGARWICSGARGFEFEDVPGLSRYWSGENVTLGEKGTITSMIDSIVGDNLMAPATVSERPTWRKTCHEANGAPTAFFYGANLQRLVASAVPPYGDERHTKNGQTVALFFVPMNTAGAGVVLDEFGATTANGPGVQYAWGSTGDTWIVSRGANLATRTGPVSKFCTGVGSIMRSNPATGKVYMSVTNTDGTTDSEIAWSGTPSYYPPAYPLTLGAYANGGAAHFTGHVACVLIWRRDLTDAEVVQVRALMESKYRAVAPAVTTNNVGPALSGSFKVLPVGDSITEGSTGASVGEEGGWRKWVNDNKGDTLINFVGTQTYGNFTDNQHQSVSGLAIKTASGAGAAFPGFQDYSSSPGSAEKFMDTLAANSMLPDVMVMDLGVNNMTMADDARNAFDHLGDLLDLCMYIHGISGCRIVLCTLTPADTGTSARHQKHNAFRLGLGSVYRELKRKGVRCAIADTLPSFPPNVTYLADLLHPTTAGYNAMAAVILPAIRYAAGVG